jgi:hypothetical protein
VRFFRWIWECVRGLFRRKARGLRTEFVAEAPEKLAARVVYVECEGQNAWLAVMLCPCGCGARINLNLLPDTQPFWTVAADAAGAPSVRPSVWRTVGCKSHFFVRRGRIDWC